MGKDRRVFGNNLKMFLVKKGIASEDFAKKIGCTEYELCKIMDARLILDNKEELTIANALDMTVDELFVERSSKEYEEVGCIECRGKFSKPENRKLILDLLDIYCDVQETVAEEAV